MRAFDQNLRRYADVYNGVSNLAYQPSASLKLKLLCRYLDLSKLSKESILVKTPKKGACNKVKDVAGASKAALSSVKVKLASQSLYTGVVIRGVISDEETDVICKAKRGDNLSNSICNINASMLAFLLWKGE